MDRGGTVKRDPEEDLRLDVWSDLERLAGVRDEDEGRRRHSIC